MSAVHVASLEDKSRRRKRGCLFFLIRGILAVVAILVAMPVLGFTYEAIMAGGDAQRYPPIGQMVDVGGHQLHLYCTGSASPTVILEGGHGVVALAWTLVQPQLAENVRTCSYDHAGLGWSELGPNPRTPERIATELHTLLQNAGIEPPYVLVGHSVGGKHIRMFAELFPNEVVGLVFEDARHESVETIRSEEQLQADASAYESSLNFFRVLRQFGIARLLGVSLGRSMKPSLNTVSDDVVALLALFEVEEDTLQSYIGSSDMASDNRLRNARSLGAMPIVVLTAESSMKTEGWSEAQQALAGLSSNSQWIVVDDSSHDIHLDKPDRVTAAVLSVVSSARTGDPLQ